jgi:hypothetical protein
VLYHAAADVPLTVTAQVTLQPGYTLSTVRTGITSVLTTLIANATTAIAVPDIINACYTVAGVLDLALLAPTLRTTYTPAERPILGTLTLTAVA